MDLERSFEKKAALPIDPLATKITGIIIGMIIVG